MGVMLMSKLDAGNAILEATFIDKLNSKFEKPAQNPDSAHRPLGNIDLNQIFCWEYERRIQHDWTFSFSGHTFQVEKLYGASIKPKASIQVRKHLDNSITAWYKNKQLSVIQLTKRPLPITKIHQLKPATYTTTNQSSWHQTNSFIYEPPDKIKEHNILRKRTS